jgi:hypothetical protein
MPYCSTLQAPPQGGNGPIRRSREAFLVDQGTQTGDQSRRAKPLDRRAVRNSCSHARVEEFGGPGMIEQMAGLPIGNHRLKCDHVTQRRPECTRGICVSLVRSEGLEPPRFYSLPPQGSASTNSATSAWKTGTGICATPDRRRRCNKSAMEGQGLLMWCFRCRRAWNRLIGCRATAAAFA